MQTQHKRTEALHVSDDLVMKADDAKQKQELQNVTKFHTQKQQQISRLPQFCKEQNKLYSKVLRKNSFSKTF